VFSPSFLSDLQLQDLIPYTFLIRLFKLFRLFSVAFTRSKSEQPEQPDDASRDLLVKSFTFG